MTDLERALKGSKNLREADLYNADLTGADLTGADLTGADLTGANLRDADLYNADLTDADLTGAHLYNADLTGANLRDANLRGTYLYCANLRDANLSGANLQHANLQHADLRGTYLRSAKPNWQSHDLISEVLRQAAESHVNRRSLAGLILVSRDWCWKEFLAIEHPEKEWALGVLREYAKDDDDAPEVLRRCARQLHLWGNYELCS